MFTRGTTEAINLVATSYGTSALVPGDEILVSEIEHHSNIVPWQWLRERHGLVLKVAPMDERGDIDVDAFRALLTARTRLVAVTAVSNALGSVTPVKGLVEAAHAVGARVLVDGAQAVPTMAVDVRDLECDFYAFSGHKVFGPTGIGVLYARESLLEAMPPYQGGGDMILSVTFDKTSYNDIPFRFEAGTGSIAGAIGLGAALRYVEALGYDRIEQHETALVDAAVRRLDDLPGVTLVGRPRKRAGAISFTVSGVHPHDLATVLDQQGVAIRAGHHCAQPAIEHFGLSATARASFSIYNTPDDIERLVAGIATAQKVFT